MSTQPNAQDQTFEQLAGMWNDLAGWSANFANGVVEAVERGGTSALERLSAIRSQYQIAISAAIAKRELASAAADAIAESVWRDAANEMSRVAFELADDTKSAADRLKIFETSVNDGLKKVGRFVGPAFDIYGVVDAIATGDGNKAGEAVLSIGLGAAIGAALASGLGFLGFGATFVAFMGGAGAVGGAVGAKYLNPHTTRPFFDWLGSYLPDGMWRGLESVTFGEGAARLDPTGSVYATMLLHRIDNTVQMDDLGRLFDVAGSARQGRETIGLLNGLAELFVPEASALPDDATDEQIIAFAGRIAAVTDKVPGGIRIASAIPSVEEARADFGAMLSLQLGLPVSIRLTGASATSPAAMELYALHRTAYERWLADSHALAQGADSASLHFTDEYLQARADYVAAVVLANAEEVTVLDGIQTVRDISATRNLLAEDRSDRTSIGVLGMTPLAPLSKLLFGSAEGDGNLVGGDQADRIFGLDGNDELNGLDGADYLEGGDGDDVLDGGAGADTLVGGNGEDIYHFSGAWGSDRIIDADGQGRIDLDGHVLSGGGGVAGVGVWRDAVRGITYSLHEEDGVRSLRIAKDGVEGSIEVAGWRNGQLGIVFDSGEIEPAIPSGPVPEPADAQVWTSVGDQRPLIWGVEVARDVLTPEHWLYPLLYGTYAWGLVVKQQGGQWLNAVTESGLDDVIFAKPGYVNYMYGGGGNDKLYGGRLDDMLMGDEGNDLLIGGLGNDTLQGGDGDDWLQDFDGYNLMEGGAGDDYIDGYGKLDGGSGNDVLYGDGELYGGDGADRLHGSGVLDGGDGDDNLYGSGVLSGGGGDDVLWLSVDEDSKVELKSGDGRDLLTFQPDVSGRRPDEVTVRLTDALPEDLIFARSGDDMIFRLPDNSQISVCNWYGSLPLVDWVEFSDGTLWGLDEMKSKVPLLYEAGSANDTIRGWDGIDVIDSGAGDDFVEVYAGNDTVNGGAGNDRINAGDGNDVLDGGDGDDVLLAGDGNNLVFGGAGADRIEAGSGNDELHGGDGDDVIDAGAGSNRILGGDGNDNIRSSGNRDEILGGAGNDVIYVMGGSGHFIDGGDGDDQIDSLLTGDQLLFGGAGNDTITGGGTLHGGTGDDVLSGDDEATTYLFELGDGRDTIVEYGLSSWSLSGAGVTDVLRFGEGIRPEDVVAGRFGDDLVLQLNEQDAVTIADWFTGSLTYVEEIHFADDTVWGEHEIRWHAFPFGDNSAPEVFADLDAQEAQVSEVFTFEVPDYAFFDIDVAATPYDALSYAAQLSSGATLPAWLSFDAATRTFNGTPPAGSEGNLTVRITVTDRSGASAAQDFEVHITAAEPESTPDEWMVGTPGNDFLIGTAGSDTFDGLAGDDYLYGGEGNDVYRWGRNRGNDTVAEGGGTDKIEVLDLNPADVQVSSDALTQSIVITDVATGKTLTLSSMLMAGMEDYFGIEQVRFADGTVWSAADLIARIGAQPPAEEITVVEADGQRYAFGTSTGDVIQGDAGTDHLYGQGGNDTLSGSDGETPLDYVTYDYLDGGVGDDVYLIELYDPAAVIQQASAGMDDVDVIRFDPIFTPDLLVFSHINREVLMIETIYGNPLAQVEGWWNPEVRRISWLEFADGSRILADDIDAQISIGYYSADYGTGSLENHDEAQTWVWGGAASEAITGGLGEDMIWAGEGDDVLAGGAGNDMLFGEAGSDTYLFGRGGGEDYVFEAGGAAGDVDVAHFAQDVSFDQLWFERVGDDLRVSVIGTGDRLTVGSWFVDAEHRLDEFRAGDGRLLVETQVQNLVQAMASFAPPAAGETTLSAAYVSSLGPTLATSWQ